MEGKNEFVFSQPQKYFNKYIFPGYGLLGLSRKGDFEEFWYIWNGTDFSKKQIEDGLNYSDRVSTFLPIRNGKLSTKDESFQYSN